jgi:hypothetical protein
MTYKAFYETLVGQNDNTETDNEMLLKILYQEQVRRTKELELEILRLKIENSKNTTATGSISAMDSLMALHSDKGLINIASINNHQQSENGNDFLFYSRLLVYA